MTVHDVAKYSTTSLKLPKALKFLSKGEFSPSLVTLPAKEQRSVRKRRCVCVRERERERERKRERRGS